MTRHENQVADGILSSAIEVHRTLGGPGLLESLYEESLCWELKDRGLDVQRQVEVPVKYKNHPLTNPLRVDLLVENLVIVECKAVVTYNPIFEAQLLTYLRLTGLKLGFVLNFGERMLKSGIHRVVNGL